MPKEEMVRELNKIRSDMMILYKEATDRIHEPHSHVHHVRTFHMLAQIANSLTTISYALMHEIDPHAYYDPK